MKLSEKKKQLILIAIVAAMVLGAIWYFFISPRYAALHHAKKVIADKQSQLQLMADTVKNVGDTSNQLNSVSTDLAGEESDIASGDPNAWIYDLVRHFKENSKIDISINGQASIGDVDLLSNFPYKQLRVSVNGTAYYHDLGNFISNFENTYPHIRLLNLTIEPGSGSDEKLSFRMDIVALMKSTSS